MKSSQSIYPYFSSLGIVFIGWFSPESALIFSLGLIVFAFQYCYSNFQQDRFKAIDIIFLFVLSMGFTSLGNLLAILSIGTANEVIYMLYAKPEYFSQTAFLMYISSLLITLGFHWSTTFQFLPKFKLIKISARGAAFLFYLSLLLLVLKVLKQVPELGTFSMVFILLPVLVIFLFARLSATYKNSSLNAYAWILLLISTVYAVLFEYLRLSMVLPSVAYILGVLSGGKSIKPLFTPSMYLIYIFFGIFITYFTILGEVRQQYVEGTQRFTMLQEADEAESEGTFFSRLSVINQVSSVFSLVEDNGFYKGNTLSYLGFAFIPRILWPEKPDIAKGRWFALEIGMAIDYGDGKVNNSINMTVPGELYLNFGWWGVSMGSFIFGVFMRAFWNATSFWQMENNLLGNLFGFYLLYMGLFSLGADIQVLVTLIALYIIFLVSSQLAYAFNG